MAKRVVQNAFSQFAHDNSGLNVHAHSAAPHGGALVVFVHGFRGSGYGTWGQFLSFMFEGVWGPPVDLATYQYAASGRRGRASWEPSVGQLVQGIDEIAAGYDEIILVGHSQGGVLGLECARRMLQNQAMANPGSLSKVAAVVAIAAPRAGTTRAPSWLAGPVPEFRWLSPFSDRLAEIDRFFTRNVQTINTATMGGKPCLMPLYAVIAGGDRIVAELSARFGVPDEQCLRLTGDHRSIVKPSIQEHAQVDWLVKVIRDVTEMRQQWSREEAHARDHKTRVVPAMLPVVVTEFWGDATHGDWESIYNEARYSATTADVEVHDHRAMSLGPADLLIAASPAEAVAAGSLAEEEKFRRVHRRRSDEDSLCACIAAVGVEHIDARARLQEWLTAEGPLPSMYVEGAADADHLLSAMTQWIKIVIQRDPRRPRSPSARVSQLIAGVSDSGSVVERYDS